MQKFRDYIYVDDDRIKSYINQIPEFSQIEVSNSHKIDTKLDGGINLKLVKAEKELSESKITTYETSMSDLERMVAWTLETENAIYFDSNSKFTTSDKDKMIILEGVMKIPEMVESFETIESLRKNVELLSMIPNMIDEESKKILSFIKNSNNIPLLIDIDSDYIISCSVKKTYANDIDDFLENIDNLITIIGKIERVYNDSEKVEIFDVSKEILKLNRTVRRKMEKEDLEKMLVIEEGPLIKIVPIIIYK